MNTPVKFNDMATSSNHKFYYITWIVMKIVEPMYSLITLCVYAQQGYASSHAGLCL